MCDIQIDGQIGNTQEVVKTVTIPKANKLHTWTTTIQTETFSGILIGARKCRAKATNR